MKASSKPSKPSDPKLASRLWIGVAGFALLGSLAVGALMILSGDEQRQRALDSGQRLEFPPTLETVEGKIIKLAELEAGTTKTKPQKPPVEPGPAETPPIAPPVDTPPAPEPEPAIAEPHTEVPTLAPIPTPAPVIPETHVPVEPAHQAPAAPVPEVTATPAPVPAAKVDLDAAPKMAGTSSSPDPVQKRVASGLVPGIAKDGTPAWKYYARKSPPKAGPRIVVVLYGLGLGSLASEAALALPADVTLSFSPYSRDLGNWIGRARGAGHEILLDLPMETASFPAMDPGPYGILNSLSEEENITRLTTILTRAGGYVGLLMPLRETVSANEAVIAPLVDAMSEHGMILLSSEAQRSMAFSNASKDAAMPVLNADLILDSRIAEAHIQAQLATLEELAKKQGFALAIGRSFPVTVEQVSIWARGLEAKGITLVPLSALAASK